ncbi:MAG: transposase [Desulfuromonadales bacterium]|nr:transposase [Desulfuromonadales bacterium]
MFVAHLNFAAESCPANHRPKSYKTLRQALRYSILLALTGLSHRALSHRVADSVLFQWFTHTSEIDGARLPSKSSIERFEKLFPSEEIFKLINDCNMAVADPVGAHVLLWGATKPRPLGADTLPFGLYVMTGAGTERNKA